MKRKELTKRLMSITMAAMMITTMVPTTAFASEADFFADSAEAVSEEANQENWDASEEFSDGMGFTDDGAEVAAEDGTNAAVELYADGETGTSANATDEEKAAAEYLKTNYVDSVILTTSGVKKNDDGSYLVGLKTDRGNNNTSIAFKYEKSPSKYAIGWYVNSKFVSLGTNKPATLGSKRKSLGITRPTAEQGPHTFIATLRIFPADTDTSIINDEAQAVENALASQDFKITLEANEPVYKMTIKVVDETGNPINDAAVTLQKNWSTVEPEEDGSYIMEKDASYSLKVKKEGYLDYTDYSFAFTFNPEEPNAIETITLKKIVNRNIKFSVIDKDTKKPVTGATVTVKKGYYDTIKPDSDGNYSLIDGTAYNYTVEATNYKTVSGSITPSDDTVITVELTKDISKYSVFIKPADASGNAVSNPNIQVTYEEYDDYYEEYDTVTLKPNSDFLMQ